MFPRKIEAVQVTVVVTGADSYRPTYLASSDGTCQSLYCEYALGRQKSSGLILQWPEKQNIWFYMSHRQWEMLDFAFDGGTKASLTKG